MDRWNSNENQWTSTRNRWNNNKNQSVKFVSNCKVCQQKYIIKSQYKSMKSMKNDRPENPTMTTGSQIDQKLKKLISGLKRKW